jgi:hypothetical protein
MSRCLPVSGPRLAAVRSTHSRSSTDRAYLPSPSCPATGPLHPASAAVSSSAGTAARISRSPHTGTVFAATPRTTGITPFTDLVAQVMTRPGYKNAPRVFIIVDNGSDHRGQAIDRLRAAHPNAIMIHTPVHASWLNQIVRHEVACEEWYSSKEDRLMSVT